VRRRTHRLDRLTSPQIHPDRNSLLAASIRTAEMSRFASVGTPRAPAFRFGIAANQTVRLAHREKPPRRTRRLSTNSPTFRGSPTAGADSQITTPSANSLSGVWRKRLATRALVQEPDILPARRAHHQLDLGRNRVLESLLHTRNSPAWWVVSHDRISPSKRANAMFELSRSYEDGICASRELRKFLEARK